MPIEIREPYAMTRRFKAALPRITPDRTGPRIHRRQKLQKQDVHKKKSSPKAALSILTKLLNLE
jgi:hypothetical protein